LFIHFGNFMASSTRDYQATKKSHTQNLICQPMKEGTLPRPRPVLLQMCCTLTFLQSIWVTHILMEIAMSWLHENLNQYRWRIKYTELFTYSCIKIQAFIQNIYMKRMNQKTNNAEIHILTFSNHGNGKWRHKWKWTCDNSILLTQVTVTSQAKSVKSVCINWVGIIHK